MTSDDVDDGRRAVLRAVAGSAVGSTMLTGTASATPDAGDGGAVPEGTEVNGPDRVVEDVSAVRNCGNCETEFTCFGDECGDDPRTLYVRMCCECGGDYVCEDWRSTGECCG